MLFGGFGGQVGFPFQGLLCKRIQVWMGTEKS